MSPCPTLADGWVRVDFVAVTVRLVALVAGTFFVAGAFFGAAALAGFAAASRTFA
jgi:hypothetical protein